MNKIYCIEHVCICTSGHKIQEGKEYLFMEGSVKELVVIEKIKYDEDGLRLELFFVNRGRATSVHHRDKNIGFLGMWRIFDKDFTISSLFSD